MHICPPGTGVTPSPSSRAPGTFSRGERPQAEGLRWSTGSLSSSAALDALKTGPGDRTSEPGGRRTQLPGLGPLPSCPGSLQAPCKLPASSSFSGSSATATLGTLVSPGVLSIATVTPPLGLGTPLYAVFIRTRFTFSH